MTRAEAMALQPGSELVWPSEGMSGTVVDASTYIVRIDWRVNAQGSTARTEYTRDQLIMDGIEVMP